MLRFLLATNKSTTAEKLQKVAKAKLPQTTPKVEASEITGLTPISCSTVFDQLQGMQIGGVIRLHRDRLADMLQRSDLIAQPVIGKG